MATPLQNYVSEYPVSKEILHKYAKNMFDSIQRNECVTAVWIPMAGRRTHNNFIINNISLFKAELPNFDNHVLVYVEPSNLTEDTMSGYVRLIGLSIIKSCYEKFSQKEILDLGKYKTEFNNEKVSYAELLDNLYELVSDLSKLSYSVVLFLGEFDDIDFLSFVFYRNLKSLWSRLFPNLQIVFLMKSWVVKKDKSKLWGDLNELILQNIVYVPLLDRLNVEYLIDKFSEVYGCRLTIEQKKTVIELCGGHPYMIMTAIKLISKLDKKISNVELEDVFYDDPALGHIVEGIIDVWGEKEQSVLTKILTNSEITSDDKEILNLLKKLNVIEEKEGKLRLFSNLAVNFMEKKMLHHKRIANFAGESILTFDQNTKQIFYGGIPIDEHFTSQETRVLGELLRNVGVTLTRDNIAEVLWEDVADEKYSDWAIDQLVSKLRKKLKDVGINAKVITLRGRGYKLQY